MNRLRPQESYVDNLRQKIEERGECIVSGVEVRALWAEDLAAADTWNAIAQLAIAEHWSFTFFPDGSVRFAPF
jgi:hypothetical protein